MARKLRLEYSGAIYHVISRGNYRSWIFETALFESFKVLGIGPKDVSQMLEGECPETKALYEILMTRFKQRPFLIPYDPF